MLLLLLLMVQNEIRKYLVWGFWTRDFGGGSAGSLLVPLHTVSQRASKKCGSQYIGTAFPLELAKDAHCD